MQATKWITFVTVLVLINGQDEFPTNPDTQNYQYHYFVRDENTGDVKSHEEKKLGDTVNGQYTVGEPNGDLRVVTYTADEGGFRANVKYEEGGSPISDKSSQTNAKSGVDFQWIPGNPDDNREPAGKVDTEDENEEQKTDEITEGASTEATTESNSETEETSEKSSSEEKEPSDENEAEEKKPVDEESSSSSESKLESDSGDKESEPKDGDNEDDEKVDDDDEKSSISKESSEEKDTNESESDEKEEEKEESAEAAESAPESEEVAATEPSQMYLPLPVLPYPNMPFLNVPSENPQRENDRPTIIYASQNFYNPWQWFSTKRIVREEQPPLEDEQAGHYMTGLGYIIVPRQQQ